MPEDFDSEILSVVETYGAFRQGADVQFIARDAVTRPRRVGGVTASWTPEGAVIPTSDMSLDGITVSMRKVAAMIRASSEVIDDAAADLGEWFVREVGLAFAQAEDAAGFAGDGSATYAGQTGLTAKLTDTANAVSATTGHDTSEEVDATNIGAVMGAVLGSAYPGACWYVAPAAYGQIICRLAATSGDS